MPYFFASTSVANLSSFVASSSPSPPVPKSFGKGRYKAGKAKPPAASAKTNKNGNSHMSVVVSAQTPFVSTEFTSYPTSSSSYPTPAPPSSSLPTPPSPSAYHKSRPTCTLSLAHAHVDAASFAHSSSTSLPTLSVPPPNLPDRSELQSPIQEDRVHQAFRFPIVSPARPVLGAGEDAEQQHMPMPTPMSFRGNVMMGAMGAMNANSNQGKRRGDTRRVSGFGGTNCIPFPSTSVAGPPSPTSSTTSYSTTTTNSMNSYTRSATSSATSVSSFESTSSTLTSTCSSVASLELKLASFPAPPSTPPHVLLRVRQAQGQTYHGQTQPRAIPFSPISGAAAAKRARKVSGFPKSTTTTTNALRSQPKPKSSPNKPTTNANAKNTAPAPIQARSLLTLAAALNKAAAPKLASSISVPPSSPKRGDVPRLTAVRRGLVDDRDRVGMERPGSPVPRVRGERWRERRQSRRVVDESESELDDAKQQQKIDEELEAMKKSKQAQAEEDEAQDLKSTLIFEPPPYSAPPPPYSPTASPLPLPSSADDTLQASRALPTPPPSAAEVKVQVPGETRVPIHAPVPKAAYVLPPSQPQSSSSSSSSSSGVRSPPPLQQATRRTTPRVSASEIRILLTLYRTLMVGLEKRYRAAEELTVQGREEKTNGKEKEKAKERFPLVEEDDDDDETGHSSVFWVVDDTEDEENAEDNIVRSTNDDVKNEEEEEEYIPRRRPPPTRVPPNSPVGSPPSKLGEYVRPSSSLSSSSSSSKHTQQQPQHEPAPSQSQSQKNTTTAELDVQDALLAIRLRVFLKAQGVSEADLDVVLFDDDEDDVVPPGESQEEDEEDDETMAVEIDRALAEMHAASAAAAAVETVVVESDALVPPMEEGMHALPPPPRPPRSAEKRPIRSSPSPPPPLVLKDHSKPSSPLSSRKLGANVNVNGGGGRISPNPPPSAAYMIALLTMRHRYSSRRSSSGSKGNYSSSLMGYPVWRRSSALKSVAWVAPLDEDVVVEEEDKGGMGTIHEQQEDEDEDVDSVVELYAGMC